MPLEYSVEKPLNREPPLKELVETFITKADTAYDRNHSQFPHIDASKHKLRVDGAVNRAAQFSMAQLRSEFVQHEVVAALQCAGNRRHTMRTKIKQVEGINWKDGAVCNCTWSGPLLCDVLSKVGVTSGGVGTQVAFSCHAMDCEDDKYYGGSISLSRCMDPKGKVILALNMNGAPLTINHGFPLRIVIPGIAGARWIKWLDTVTVQSHESTNFYMQRDYKILPPEVETRKQADDYWHKVKPMQGLPVNSAICRPESGDGVLAGRELEVAGYALPQGDDGPVVKVEVSTDEGKTWENATILFPNSQELAKPGASDKYKWCWAIWQYKMPADKTRRIDKATKIWSRATDAGGNMQTMEDNRRWNFRGVGYNGFGEVTGLKLLGSGGGESARQAVVGLGDGKGGGVGVSASEKGVVRTSKL